MPVKQIQLRGISRAPSDRLSADGGVAESINLHVDMQEQVPTFAGNDITSSVAPGIASDPARTVYIHPVGTAKYYISIKGANPVKLYAYPSSGTAMEVLSLNSGEEFVSINSIGNYIIVTGDQSIHYALFKDDHYIDLGDNVPRPNVTFATEKYEELLSQGYTEKNLDVGRVVMKASDFTPFANLAKTMAESESPLAFWKHVLSSNSVPGYSDYDESVNFKSTVNDAIWATVNNRRTVCRGDKIFSAPVFVRTALKLIDGSYVFSSAPVLLMGMGGDQFADIQCHRFVNMKDNSGEYDGCYFYYYVRYNHLFKAKVTASINVPENWSNLIESFDVFLSTDVLSPSINAEIEGAYETNDTSSDSLPDGSTGKASISFRYKGDNEIATDDLERKIRSIGNFYKVASYKISEMPTDKYLTPFSQDDLVVKNRLTSDYAHAISSRGQLFSYNQRLLLSQADVVLDRGSDIPQAMAPESISPSPSNSEFSIVYHVRGASGEELIVKGYHDYETALDQMRGFIMYPDSKAFLADVYVDGILNTSFKLEEHPGMNCAYAFKGLGVKLVNDNLDPAATPNYPSSERREFSMSNRLFMSDVDSPFVFPIGNRHGFNAEIVGVSTTTTALSAGIFGQYPIYVFTGDGIWTAQINSEGTFDSFLPVSRDVAIRNSICLLDQSIVFSTKNGVKIIAGNDIKDISEAMIGKHYKLSDDIGSSDAIRTVLANHGYGSLLPIADDGDSFMEYMVSARPILDYKGKRVVFFNAGESFMYCYYLSSGTWHKQVLDFKNAVGSWTFCNTLNSYPDAQVVLSNDGQYKIIDMSTLLEEQNTGSVTAMLVTRRIDLGESDVRKTIKDIKIRGSFSRNDVKYMLFGSMDGLKYVRLTTLHGGSYHYFKIAILCKLEQNEHISWIDISYDSKFTNKLR